ncbi:hypothetical protein ABZ424_25430 [Streptomyces sp. NPDC005790]
MDRAAVRPWPLVIREAVRGEPARRGLPAACSYRPRAAYGFGASTVSS